MWLAVCLHDLILEASPVARTHGPAVVADTDELRVAAANPAAQALGIDSGCALNAALAMADALRIEPRDTDCEQRAMRSLAIWARTLTPAVSIVRPNILLLEIRGSLRLFGGAERIKAVVDAQLAKRGLSGQMSLAPSAQAATWLSRHGDCDVAEEDESIKALRDLPLSVTGWPDALLERLSEMGVRHISDLLRLPRQGLALRIGQACMRELDRAMGRAFEPITVTELPEKRSWSIELPAETDDESMLIEGCEILLDRLMGELRHRQRQISRFAVRFFHLRRTASCEAFELIAPTYDKRHLLDLMADRLERISLPAPVISLELSTGELLEVCVDAPELFSRARQQTSDVGMIERLQDRCGPRSVYSVALADDHRPESAWSACSVPVTTSAELSPWAGERPLWLLPQPQPCNASSFRIELGPERIESGWWDGKSVNRDYYIARFEAGERLWVYFDHRELRWYLHGVFG
ncbi:MAG: DNA polymerase Y family protein [Gammaproteobacteria bacterium]